VYSVISVNDKRLPGNTKKWTLVRAWLITVRLVHSWAVDLFDFVWLVRLCLTCSTLFDLSIPLWHEAFTCATTHSHVPRLIHLCHDSFTCAMTYSHALVQTSHVTHEWVVSLLKSHVICARIMSHMPYLCGSSSATPSNHGAAVCCSMLQYMMPYTHLHLRLHLNLQTHTRTRTHPHA